MSYQGPRVHRLPRRTDFKLIPAPLDLSLPLVTEKSPLPAIIVTPSSPSSTRDFSIAFLATPPKPTLRQRILSLTSFKSKVLASTSSASSSASFRPQVHYFRPHRIFHHDVPPRVLSWPRHTSSSHGFATAAETGEVYMHSSRFRRSDRMVRWVPFLVWQRGYRQRPSRTTLPSLIFVERRGIVTAPCCFIYIRVSRLRVGLGGLVVDGDFV
ncbi:hypothetical protein CPB84DRAFT_1966765 [Gymnopilus junonius]|uniref:Uncharacterized protein n=1 Tax=Gymnopilus junonius TaxID=109634 RepID=A0A9P5TFQ1_GYMJU|nr:hypothetical protein CPB84DRAFT_1966765 [Gymnopilus junonius]